MLMISAMRGSTGTGTKKCLFCLPCMTVLEQNCCLKGSAGIGA